jgi:hypothetical protein
MLPFSLHPSSSFSVCSALTRQLPRSSPTLRNPHPSSILLTCVYVSSRSTRLVHPWLLPASRSEPARPFSGRGQHAWLAGRSIHRAVTSRAHSVLPLASLGRPR